MNTTIKEEFLAAQTELIAHIQFCMNNNRLPQKDHEVRRLKKIYNVIRDKFYAEPKS